METLRDREHHVRLSYSGGRNPESLFKVLVDCFILNDSQTSR